MATTTATFFFGRSHPNHSGINPTYLIRFTENDRPTLIMQSLESNDADFACTEEEKKIIQDFYQIKK